MKCPRCHAANPDASRYCAECGSTLRPSGSLEGLPTKTIVSPIEAVSTGELLAGKYRIIDEIGRGGMGVVVRAEDTRLKRTVALKFLSLELTGNSEARERFIQEARAASALEHPNICTIFEINETPDGRMFTAMACYEGESLREKLRRGKLDYGEALGVAVQVARGLAKAHDKGIVHRDIKPGNIFLTDDGQAKILDFGLAKLAADMRLTRTGATLGTVAYMSPEQAQGRPVDGRTDIWSLGVVLYEMLTGELPFSGESEGSLLYFIIKRPARPLLKADPAIPTAIERVVLRALEKNPADRYQKMGDLLSDLEALVEGLKPLKAKAGLFRGRILGVRKSIFLAASAVILIIAVLGLLTFLSGPGRADVFDSVAILPIINETGDEEKEYFANSLTRQLNAALYKVGALTVPPAESVMTFKGSDKRPEKIAEELGVKAVVQVSWLQVGSRHRLIYTLSDPFRNKVIAADTLEREGEDILYLQNEFARAVVEAVKVAVTPSEQALLAGGQKVNPEAFDLLMKGYNSYRVSLNFTEAQDYFNRAINADPNLALAHAYTGMLYWDMGINGRISEKEAYPKAREALQKALELDNNLAIAHSHTAFLMAIMDWDFSGAERAFKKSLDLEPGNFEVQGNYNVFLRIMGRFEEGIKRQKRLEESAPPGHSNLLASFYLWANRLDEGLEIAEDACQKSPTLGNKYWLAVAYRLNGKLQEALTLNQEFLDQRLITQQESLGEIAIIHGLSGKREDAQKTMERVVLLCAEKNVDPSFFLASFYGALGEKDKAMEFLSQAFKNRLGVLINLKTYPDFRCLHGDPRFEDLVKKMGFPAAPAEVKD